MERRDRATIIGYIGTVLTILVVFFAGLRVFFAGLQTMNSRFDAIEGRLLSIEEYLRGPDSSPEHTASVDKQLDSNSTDQ